MADSKPSAPATPKLAETTVVEIKPTHKRLSEPHYRVTDEHLPQMMVDKGITTPLRRVRGISKTNAEKAGIETPKE